MEILGRGRVAMGKLRMFAKNKPKTIIPQNAVQAVQIYGLNHTVIIFRSHIPISNRTKSFYINMFEFKAGL